jgi:hypothetical protein
MVPASLGDRPIAAGRKRVPPDLWKDLEKWAAESTPRRASSVELFAHSELS